MSDLGRILIFFGIFLIVLGVILVAFARLNIPLGHLPGDLSWRGRGWTVSLPIATSLVISVVLSLILWAISHIKR